jgi:hypothetical protein
MRLVLSIFLFLPMFFGWIGAQVSVITDTSGRVLLIKYPDSSYIRIENREGYHWRRIYNCRGKLIKATVEEGELFLKFDAILPRRKEEEENKVDDTSDDAPED